MQNISNAKICEHAATLVSFGRQLWHPNGCVTVPHLSLCQLQLWHYIKDTTVLLNLLHWYFIHVNVFMILISKYGNLFITNKLLVCVFMCVSVVLVCCLDKGLMNARSHNMLPLRIYVYTLYTHT